MNSKNFSFQKLFDTYGSIIVLDTETSGLSPEADRIIELSAVKLIHDGEKTIITDEFDELIKLPKGQKIPKKIVELTHITDEMLETDGLFESEVCEMFCDLFSEEKVLVAAYNAQFDMNFLFYFFARCKRLDILAKINMLDVLTVYKDRHEYPHKLESAIEVYNLSDKVKNSHRAIDDTLATVEVLKCMELECDDLKSYINLFGYNPKYGPAYKRIRSITYKPQAYKTYKKLYE